MASCALWYLQTSLLIFNISLLMSFFNLVLVWTEDELLTCMRYRTDFWPRWVLSRKWHGCTHGCQCADLHPHPSVGSRCIYKSQKLTPIEAPTWVTPMGIINTVVYLIVSARLLHAVLILMVIQLLHLVVPPSSPCHHAGGWIVVVSWH